MSQNDPFSRHMLEALKAAVINAAAERERVTGNVDEKLRAAIVASVDVPVSVHIHRPAVCYRCADKEKEAFPYGVTTIFGDEYTFLCNDCWAELLNAGLIASVEDEAWPDEEEE